MIPKSEFETILRTHGHSVILQRRSDTNESGPYLEVAGGRYRPTAEKWTAWRYYAGATRSILGDRQTPMGLVDGSGAIFYLQAACLPKKGDLISEDTPHERTDRNTFRVEFVVPYYDANELIFFAAHCKLLDPVS